MKKIVIFVLKSFFVASFVFFVVTLIFIVFISNKVSNLQGKIYPNVVVDNVNFGGKNVNDVKKYLVTKKKRLRDITLEINYHDLQVATISGQDINFDLNIDETANQAYGIGRDQNLILKWQKRLESLLNLRKFTFKSILSFTEKPMYDSLSDLEVTYNVKPQDALFRFENGKVTAFKIEQNGLQIDKEAAIAQFKDIVSKVDKQQYFKIIIKDQIISPKITLASINSYGIVEKIGEGKSNYKGSIPGRIHNVILASSKFDGVLIPKDENFSFNNTIGDISADKGYLQAYIIKDGRTILGDGGGVCQVSTTLFRAALNSGLPITKRTAHAYRVHYYENDSKPGFDATVFSPSTDFRFANDTPAYILIQRELDKTTMDLKFVFYGKKDGRIARISGARLYDSVPPPEPLNQDDPTLKKGEVKQVDWAAWGAKTVFNYTVVKDGKEAINKDFFSNFKPWRAIYLVGTGE